ncbi:glutathione S-transferase T3-like [Trifolium medium]|uniref:Glutathione S-transferase T3-like n=1 Tax=Trifolium medium TaxID=97028 RepID=A0A392NAA3_9FABA|nr:glutathione S-transferase T3-like [Trifolium medium]
MVCVEDLLLVQSWLNVSKDPIQGNGQKSTTFWKRITSNYNKYREASYHLRTVVKEKARFQKLSKIVQVFVGCYKSVTNPPKSRHSEADIVDVQGL